MALLGFARGLIGESHDATPITMELDPDNRAAGRQPTDGTPVECAVMDVPGREITALGLDMPQKVRRVFFDPTADGVPPVDEQDRLRVRGETLNVLSVQRIPAGSMAGSIVLGLVVNE